MNETRIHPTAVVHPGASLGPGCVVGPGAVIDGEVELGEGCILGPHVYLTGRLVAGPRNHFHAGAVLGDAPQDGKYRGEPTRLRIGRENTFRENVTVHRSSTTTADTTIGDKNLFMVSSHVGHNCRIGCNNILANGVLLAGHVTLEDGAFLSGNCIVHQFCRIGRLAMMRGGAGISQDLPPFCIVRGENQLCGLNTIGLRRAGIGSSERLELRKAYQLLFRSGFRRAEALAALRHELPGSLLVMEWVAFVEAARRGVCADPGRRRGALTDDSAD